MAAEPRNGARGGAAAARSRAAHLSRAQLEQKAKGQPAMLVNLRIVMSATAVTILLLLFAFAGLGLLFLARSPQEPIVTKLDLSPPLVPPAKLEPASQVKTKTIPIPAPVAETPPVKAEETVSAPQPKKEETVVVPPPKKEEVIAAPQNPEPVREPEMTATIPPPVAAKPETVQENVAKQRRAPKRQRAIRRAPPKKAEPQYTNPFTQLFGGSKK
jgi:hypothetical protein